MCELKLLLFILFCCLLQVKSGRRIEFDPKLPLVLPKFVDDKECIEYAKEFIHSYGKKIKVVGCSNVQNDIKSQIPIWRRSNSNLNFKIKYENVTKELNLFRKEGLVSKSTTVWLARSNKTRDRQISNNYTEKTVNEIMLNFDDYSLYQDPIQLGSMVIYKNFTTKEYLIEGFIENFILRYLPQSKKYMIFSISVHHSHYEMDDMFMYYGYPFDNNPISFSLLSHLDEIKIKSLVAFDYETVAFYSHEEVMKNMIVYFNAVDMMFSNFTLPKINLKIEGIILPVDENAADLYTKSVSLDGYIRYTSDLPSWDYFFYEKSKFFSSRSLDVVFVMTNEMFHFDDLYIGNEVSATEITRKADYCPQTAVHLFHPDFQGIYAAAVQTLGRILESEVIYKQVSKCHGVMTEIQKMSYWPLKWSQCDVETFRTAKLYCFDDEYRRKIEEMSKKDDEILKEIESNYDKPEISTSRPPVRSTTPVAVKTYEADASTKEHKTAVTTIVYIVTGSILVVVLLVIISPRFINPDKRGNVVKFLHARSPRAVQNFYDRPWERPDQQQFAS